MNSILQDLETQLDHSRAIARNFLEALVTELTVVKKQGGNQFDKAQQVAGSLSESADGEHALLALEFTVGLHTV